MTTLAPASGAAGTLLQRLDGATQLLGIIGDPVVQVKAPRPLTQLLQSRGHNAVLVPMHVEASEVGGLLDALLAVRNFAGLIVTVPHKQVVAGLGVELGPAARAAEAVNVVRKIDGRWQADLLDGAGFLASLVAAGFDVKGRRVCIAGAGGAGNAIAFALAAAGAARIELHDVDSRRADALVARLRVAGHGAGTWDGMAGGADLLVNATPMGLRATDPLPFARSAIRSGMFVADVIMEPHMTALLAAATEEGARIVHGRGMMDHQLDRMVEFFARALAQPHPLEDARS